MSDYPTQSQIEEVERDWEGTDEAGDDFLPAGEYTFLVTGGMLFSSAKKGTPGYRVSLTVHEGPQAGKKSKKEFWLTPAAIGYAKKDLAKLGVTSKGDLTRPLKSGMIVTGKVMVQKLDNGNEYSQVERIEFYSMAPVGTPLPATKPTPQPRAEPMFAQPGSGKDNIPF